MKKRIIKWLFGEEWDVYLELHIKYIKELEKHRETLNREGEVIKTARETLDLYKETTEKNLKLLDENIKLLQLCKENMIDVTEIYQTH